jgi:hypothetical protein
VPPGRLADDLERALHKRWDRDTLAVYADALQAKGDPRGELIALDLAGVAHGRTKRLYEWLGGSTILGRAWHERSFRFGFLDDFLVTHDTHGGCVEYIEALRASPAGAYVRGLTITGGDESRLREAFGELVKYEWPWLERLDISVVEQRRQQIGTKLVDAVVTVTPRLHTLSLHGAPVLAAWPHPATRTLLTETTLLPIIATVPDLSALDLLIDTAEEDVSPADIAAAIRPSLRHVDLARNEPSYPPQNNPDGAVYRIASVLPLASLARLRLPSLRTPEQCELLQRIRALAPRLDIEVARIYVMHAAVTAAAPIPLPAPRLWPPRDHLSSREALTITLPTEEYGDDISLTRLLEILEDQFDALPEPARVAQHDFWRFLDRLGWDDEAGNPITLPFPVETLLAAVEPLDDWIDYSGRPGPWAQLAEKLRAAEVAPGVAIQIRRYWGW